ARRGDAAGTLAGVGRGRAAEAVGVGLGRTGDILDAVLQSRVLTEGRSRPVRHGRGLEIVLPLLLLQGPVYAPEHYPVLGILHNLLGEHRPADLHAVLVDDLGGKPAEAVCALVENLFLEGA